MTIISRVRWCAGDTAGSAPASDARPAYNSATPHRHRPALLTALQRSFTTASWLTCDAPSLLEDRSARGSIPESGSAPSLASLCRPTAAGRLEAEFGAAEGLQRLLVKGMAAAERVGLKFECLRSSHDQLRISLCTLWQVTLCFLVILTCRLLRFRVEIFATFLGD